MRPTSMTKNVCWITRTLLHYLRGPVLLLVLGVLHDLATYRTPESEIFTFLIILDLQTCPSLIFCWSEIFFFETSVKHTITKKMILRSRELGQPQYQSNCFFPHVFLVPLLVRLRFGNLNVTCHRSTRGWGHKRNMSVVSNHQDFVRQRCRFGQSPVHKCAPCRKAPFSCYIVKTHLYVDVSYSDPFLPWISDNRWSRPKKSEHTHLQLKHEPPYTGWPSSFCGLRTWRLVETIPCGWPNNLVILRSRCHCNVRTRFFFGF